MAGLTTGIILIILCILYTLSVWPENSRKSRMLAFSKQYIAHRGLFDNAGDAPENSMLAFRRAVDQGYGIETDVQMSSDGRLVLVHDFNLKRVTGADLEVKNCSYREMKNHFLFGSEQRVPLFSDFLSLVQGRVPLIIEIKCENKADCDDLCREVAYALDLYEGTACIESFNPWCVRWFRKNHPAMLRGQLSGNYRREHWAGGMFDFVLTACMFNFLTRPDFIAYNLNNADTFPFRFLRNVCRACTVAWTVRSEDDLEKAKKNFDVFIFEGFEPERKPEIQKEKTALQGGKDLEGKIRRHMILSGRVQGVGFRYRATFIAEAVGVSGWVRNLYDERVEMELQGTDDEIREMMRRLNQERYIQIDQVESEDIPVIAGEYEFKVRY